MSFLSIVCLIIVVAFTALLMAPFAGFILGDLTLHATILFSGVGHITPVLFFAAIYEGLKS